MSANIFEKVTDCMVDTCKTVGKSLNIILGRNMPDFSTLFVELGLCNKSKVYPRLYNYYFEDYHKSYIVTCPVGLAVEDFEKVSPQIAHFLGVEEKDLRIKRIIHDIEIKVITGVPSAVYDPEIHKAKGFKIPIGIDLDTLEIKYWDLADPANAHGYAAGGTRCGKSTLIRLISTILIQKSVADVQLSWINIKKVDGIEFKDCKNVVHYTENEEEATDILIKNVEEMNRRYTLFSKHKGVKTIWNYRSKVNKMPIRLIIIEELAGFEQDKEFHQTLKLIAQQGAGAGIFLLVATQLPNKDVLPNLTKQNINTVFGGKCKDAIRSDIIVDDGELHKLRGKGHFKVFDCNSYGSELQVFWIDDEVVEDIAQRNLKRKFKQNKRAIEAATSITHGDND